MGDLVVGRMSATYRLPRARLGEAARLDGVLHGRLQAELGAALDGPHPWGDRQEICIRRLDVPVHLRLTEADWLLGATWSRAILEALEHAVTSPVPDVVVYPARVHVLLDLAVGVALGDYRRVWAWRQLGLWRAPDPADDIRAQEELLGALVGDPALIVPALAGVAERSLFRELYEAVPDQFWTSVAQAALGAVGSRSGIPTRETPPRGLTRRGRTAHAGPRGATILRSGRVARAAAGVGPSLSPDARIAIAVLAVLEAEPGAAAMAPGDWNGLVLSVADAFAFDDRPHQPAVEEPTDRATLENASDRSVRAAASPRPMLPGLGPSPDEPPVPQDSLGPDVVSLRAAEAPEGIGGSAEESDRAGSGPADWEAGSRNRTQVAGTLFLLHVLDELELPAAIANDPVFGDRSIRWVLHRLAMQLGNVGPDDPAALAFCGLAPGEGVPWEDEPDPTSAERAGLEAQDRAIVAGLRRRLQRPDARRSRILRTVCRRPGEIVSEPGWLEVHLQLRDVSTELRRAGLDLDLDWVPWLGVVVRFVYD